MNREEALDVALGQIERQFGKGSVMRMNDQAQVAIGAISTGSLSLDLALGIGGLPRGRIIEVFGPESSGKTTLVYHVIAEAQRRGGICAFIDAEHAMDPSYARRIGVDIDELLVSQPDTGEQALEIAELLVRSGALDVVAVDSVAALTPKAEIEGEMGDSHVGLQARLMSQALRKLAGTLNRTDTICLFTNQLREKIGVMFGCLHGSTQVLLADGTYERIDRIVNEKMLVEVMSMDPETGVISPKQVVDYFRNGETDNWLRFEIEGGRWRTALTCTPNHLVFTPHGERHAFELDEGDEVLLAPAPQTHAVTNRSVSNEGSTMIATLPRVLAATGRVIRKSATLPASNERQRYDLEIAGTHSYIANGVVVHNSPETTPGGRALKFYSSVRLDIRRIETLKDGAEAFGNRVRVKVVKNKVAPPFKQAEFDVIYGQGISWEGSVLDVALEKKIVQKSGSYFSFGDERLGQGRQNATAFLAENPDLVQAILARIQADAPAEQVVSARLLPQAEGAPPEAKPIEAEVAAEA
jgi:RecA/RadA recombinase